MLTILYMHMQQNQHVEIGQQTYRLGEMIKRLKHPGTSVIEANMLEVFCDFAVRFLFCVPIFFSSSDCTELTNSKVASTQTHT